MKQKPVVHTEKIFKTRNQYIPLDKTSLIPKRRWEGRKKDSTKQWKTTKITVLSPYVSEIILNVNVLNCPIKRHSGRMNKKCYLQQIILTCKDICRLK